MYIYIYAWKLLKGKGEEGRRIGEGERILQNASMYYENKCACIIYIRTLGWAQLVFFNNKILTR